MYCKVCHLTSVHNPFDTRIFFKEANSLNKFGYEVVIIAQHDKDEVVGDIKIISVKKTKQRIIRMLFTTLKIFALAIKEQAKIYHIHDPELIPVGIFLKCFNKKVIYDIHELVYFQIKDKHWIKKKYLSIFLQKLYLIFENISIRFFDGIVLAEDGYVDYFYSRYKNKNKFITARNFPLVSFIDKQNKHIINQNNKFILIYAGALSRVRGIKEIVESMQYLNDRAELWLIGKWHDDQLRAECESLAGWKLTKYLGFLRVDKVYEYMKAADVGLSMLYPIENYLTSVPVKAFEYMTCKKPIVMSNFSYWMDVFKDCAVFADPCDSRDIALKIFSLLEDNKKVNLLGDAGKNLVINKYSWEVEENKLKSLYEKISEE